MDLTEKTASSEKVYEGRWLKLYHDEVTLPDGGVSPRDYIRHPGAVAVVALTDGGAVLMEHQYRYPVRRVVTEIPAGKLDGPEEDSLDAARRELREETGFTARKWTSLGFYVPAAAYTDEVISLYLAEGLSKTEQDLDEDEFLEIYETPLKDAAEACLDGTVSDGKTIAAVLRAAKRRNLL